MFVVSHIRDVFSHLPALGSIIPGRQIQISNSQKLVVVSVTAGVAVVTMLARYLRRRRRTLGPTINKRVVGGLKRNRGTPGGTRSPNGDISQTGSPGMRGLHRQGSVLSGLNTNDRMSVASGSSVAGGDAGGVGAQLTPQQLGVMGMEALETTISYWEDALSAYSVRTTGSNSLAVTSVEDAEFSRELQKILDAAYNLQEESELLFLDQRSVLFRTDSLSKLPGETGENDSRISGSCAESFVSAQDEVADLREFEEFAEVFTDCSSFPLYQAAIRQFEESGIPYRCLRTEMVRCGSDVEYLCKLHCIRLAFRCIFKDSNTWQWFADSGRQVLTDLLLYADKDPKEFIIAYEDMMSYLQDKRNWEDFETELYAKEVKALTFYDVVLDYILMDAFEDLESPPSSVTAVVQNRWLSNGFKETALTTAVWSVLKAKRRMLKFPTGFMAHFYAISEQMSPLMAWGFLGPDESLRDTCLYFKNQVMAFLVDIFSFQKTRYTIVEELAEDILKHVQFRINNITQKLGQG